MAGNALTVYDKVDNPVAFAQNMAKTFAAMCGVPLEQGEAVALTCLIEGLTPVDYRRRYHTIEGKPTMRADAMLAEFRLNHGGKHRIVERSPERAAIVLVDRDANENEFALTWEQAKLSRWPWKDRNDHNKGLKDNWSTPTDRQSMLWARVISDGLRAVCPELVAGVYTPEEIEDTLGGGAAETNGHAAPPRKSASEILAVQAQLAKATAALAEHVEDAEFERKADSARENVEAAQAATEARNGSATSAEPPKGTIRRDQLKTIEDLGAQNFGDKWPVTLTASLAQRNVPSLASLSAEQAKEMISRLRDRLKGMQAASTEATTSPN